MTVAELIQKLEGMPGDMLVVKRRHAYDGPNPRWDSLDGHWFTFVDVVLVGNPLYGGSYREARGDEDDLVTALDL